MRALLSTEFVWTPYQNGKIERFLFLRSLESYIEFQNLDYFLCT